MHSRLVGIATVAMLGCGAPDGAVDEPLSCTGVGCTVNVAVDDEIGSVCTTRVDGSYRCFAKGGVPSLPVETYQWVQAGRQGPVGLTRDGRIVTAGVPVPPDLPRVIELSTTNMWGRQGLCYRTVPDGPLYVFNGEGQIRTYEGPFRSAFCAYEGQVCGLRSNGSALCPSDPPLLPAHSSWRQLALGVKVFCGVGYDGNVVCGPGPLSEKSCAPGPDGADVCSVVQPAPIFPEGRYAQVAVTYKVACALSAAGELLCLRADGAVVPTPADRYTFIDAGRDVVCAIRTDGTTGCWRHDLGPDWDDLAVTRFDPIEPAIDPGW